VIITLIFYRLVFFPLDPAAFEPSYWITAGAEAITSLAGATLMANSHGARFWSYFALSSWASLFWPGPLPPAGCLWSSC